VQTRRGRAGRTVLTTVFELMLPMEMPCVGPVQTLFLNVMPVPRLIARQSSAHTCTSEPHNV
jgi:hypothetical protein